MTPTQKRLYEADQERKAQEAGWVLQWRAENCSPPSCPETLEEAERDVAAAIRRDGRAKFARMMREGAELRAEDLARRRHSIEEAERTNAELEAG